VIYGPGLLSEGNLIGRMIADHIAGKLPGLLGAERRWSFAWVDAVAAAHVAALEHRTPQAGYQVGGPNLPQITPFEVLRRLTGTRLPRRLPLWIGPPVAWLDETRARLTGRAPRPMRAAGVNDTGEDHMSTAVQPTDTSTYAFGDMNGPLTYWGPVQRRTPVRPSRERTISAADITAISQLGRTLHGRTWAGTNALMSALFAPESEPVLV
jgi:hypothetical protein